MHETRRKCIGNCSTANCCASNFQQGGGEVSSPLVLRKAKLWNDSTARNCWRYPGETLEMILA